MNFDSKATADEISALSTIVAPELAAEAIQISVVIPCLNEAKSIAFCIDKAFAAFRRLGISGEVVVSDNGSTDGSPEIAELHGARVVHAVSRGYGSALRRGIEEAKGQFIIVGDGDDSYDFSEIDAFVAKWHEGYEFIIGNRFLGEIKTSAMPGIISTSEPPCS